MKHETMKLESLKSGIWKWMEDDHRKKIYLHSRVINKCYLNYFSLYMDIYKLME